LQGENAHQMSDICTDIVGDSQVVLNKTDIWTK
jgi:hypothetical protein